MFKLLTTLLLLYASMAYAAPPATPTLDIETQGTKVQASWYAVGATGYRLYYVYPSDVKKVETVDMGNLTELSTVMEPNTAIYVAVQAYNDDGDGTSSEYELVLIYDDDDVINGATINTNVLRFHSVNLDTPITFIPIKEDTKIQTETINNAQQNQSVGYGVAFEEGRIGMTAHIAPTAEERESLELSFCLDVAGNCESLLVWDNKNTYANTLTVHDLPNDVEKSIYVELLLPAALTEKLRGLTTEAKSFTVYASDVNSTDEASQLVEMVNIPIVNLGDENTETTSEDENTDDNAKIDEELQALVSQQMQAEESLINSSNVRRTAKNVISNSTNGHYYEVVESQPLTIFDANKKALSSYYNDTQGYLVAIENEAEQHFIEKNLKLGKWDKYWMGGVHFEYGGKKYDFWFNTILTSISYNHFYAGFGTDRFGYSIGGSHKDFYWYTRYRTEKLPGYIIEYDPANKTSSSSSSNSSSSNNDSPNSSSSSSSTSSQEEKEDKPVKYVTCTPEGKGVRCSKKFGKAFKDGKFGVEFAVYPNLWIYKVTESDKSNAVKGNSGFGASLGAMGEVKANIYDVKIGIADINVDVIKNSGKLLTAQAKIFVLGAKIYSKSEGRNQNGWQNCSMNHYCSEQPNKKESEADGGDAANESMANRNGRDLEKNIAKYEKKVEKSVSKTIMVVFIPVKLKVGIEGNVALGVGAMLEVLSDGMKFTIGGGPEANIAVFASAGLNFFIAEVNAVAKLTLISEALDLAITAYLKSRPTLGGELVNTLQGPVGKLYLSVTWARPKFSTPFWEEVTREKTVVTWESMEPQKHILFKFGEDGNEKKGATSADIKSGKSSGEYIPVFTDKEPPSGVESWACFYTDRDYRGKTACVEMPKNYKEVHFTVSHFGSGWDNSISSIKMKGPLRLGVFEHDIKRTDSHKNSSAYWYARKNDMEEIPYVGDFFNDEISGILMTELAPSQSSAPKPLEVCFYRNKDNTVKKCFVGDKAVPNLEKEKFDDEKWMKNRISRLAIKGFGVVCLYEDFNYKYGGDDDIGCYAGKGYNVKNSDGWRYFNLSGMNDRANSIKMYSLPKMALIEDLSNNLSNTETTSLVNSRLNTAEELNAISGSFWFENNGNKITKMMGTKASDGVRGSQQASVLAVRGPISLYLYDSKKRTVKDGKDSYVSMFFLDKGEWDVTALLGIFNDVSSFNYWNENHKVPRPN